MLQKLLINNQSENLLLLFAGWASEPGLLRHFRPGNSDLMLCYDYRNLHFDAEPLRQYAGVQVVGWSFGVAVAAYSLSTLNLPNIKDSVAVNGTMFPIDEQRGISPEIFHTTLQHLSEDNLDRFRRRMCGGATAYAQAFNFTTERTFASCKRELEALAKLFATPTPSFDWDRAYIGNADRIFTPENQICAWQHVPTIRIDEPHFSITLFDTLKLL